MTELKNTLHRYAKALLDSGEAQSYEEALQILSGYRLTVYAGPEVATSPTLQAALLTIVNAGSRCLLGGINVIGCPDAPRRVALPGPEALQDAVVYWGGQHTVDADLKVPAVVLGDALPREGEAPVLRATFDGWSAAVHPWNEDARMAEEQEFTPSGVLAGALAVSEPFQFFRGRNAVAGRRKLGLSLWQPDMNDPWTEPACRGPRQIYLPQKLWVIGLGHLGQALLWTLAALPYPNPEKVTLVLQDFDRMTEANRSTSLLTRPDDIGQMKTRRMAEISEARGFQTVIVERPFDELLKVGPADPPLAFCGVDNVATRRALEAPGFAEVIEAGLGHQGEEFLAFQLHSLPGSKAARDLWCGQPEPTAIDRLDQPAYRELLAHGADRCGLIEVAGVTVGVPFVGAAVSALVVAEAVRAAMGQHRYAVLDGSLRDPVRRTAIRRADSTKATNLGFLATGE